MAGLSSTGFTTKTSAEIRAAIEAYIVANWNPLLDQSDTEAVGKLHAIITEELAALWDLAALVYASRYPSTATGVALDNVSSITGTTREAAQKSSGLVVCNFDSDFSAPAGTLVCYSAAYPDWLFTNAEDIDFPAGGGTAVEMEATETGDRTVPINQTDWEIATPISGWNTVGPNNQEALTGGSVVETDEELQERREVELDAQGKATLESITSAVNADEENAFGKVKIEENIEDITVNGIKPHAIRATGAAPEGINADVLTQTLFDTIASGIGTDGDLFKNVTDSQGVVHAIYYSLATPVFVAVDVEIDVLAGTYPSDGDDLIAAAVTAFITGLEVGEDVLVSQVKAVISNATGVIDITSFDIGPPPTPSGSSNIVIDPDEWAITTALLIDVTSTEIPGPP